MSKHPPDPEQQTDSPQPRIDQHSGDNLHGGQQAIIGNENFQYQDNSANYTYNIHLELQEEDLEPLDSFGKILSYLKVLGFLIFTLISWLFFGLFTSFPFPYGQAVDLFLCCFRGTVVSRINVLQKNLQSVEINSKSVQRLNNLDFQAQLQLGVLRRFSASTPEGGERLARTLDALKRKRKIIRKELKPRQSEKYRKVQNFFDSLGRDSVETDLLQIEEMLEVVTLSIHKGYPSEAIVQDTIKRFAQEMNQRACTIAPDRRGILYRVENLLNEIQDNSNLDDSELSNLNRRLRDEIEWQEQEVQRLYSENQKLNQELDDLDVLVDERESKIFELEEELRNLEAKNQFQTDQICDLSSQLNGAITDLAKSQDRKSSLEIEISSLKQELVRKQDDLSQLQKQLKKYYGMKPLQGKYVGNLSRKGSSYHFNNSCQHWKMLAYDYVLNIDSSRNIENHNSPTPFIRSGLIECEICADKKPHTT